MAEGPKEACCFQGLPVVLAGSFSSPTLHLSHSAPGAISMKQKRHRGVGFRCWFGRWAHKCKPAETIKRDRKNATTGNDIGMTKTASNTASQAGHSSLNRCDSFRAASRMPAMIPMPTAAPITSADTVVGGDGRAPVTPPMAPATGVISIHTSITFILPPNGSGQRTGAKGMRLSI
jgi:hypothetical protein